MKIKEGLEATWEKIQWHILRYYHHGLPHCISKISRLLATKFRPNSEASPCGTDFSLHSYFVSVAIIRPTIHTLMYHWLMIWTWHLTMTSNTTLKI